MMHCAFLVQEEFGSIRMLLLGEYVRCKEVCEVIITR